jgi:hypothetical protein
MKKPGLVGAMCASVLFVYLPLAQADVVEDVETVMNKDVFGQSVFASSYATLSANSTINGDVSSGAATTYGAGANVNWRNFNSSTSATYATPSPVTQDVINAQAFLSGLEPDVVLLPSNIGADVTYGPRVYEVAGPLSMSAGTTITLDAQNLPGVFIFNISDFLSFGAGVNVVMINDTEDTRVIWNITGTYISLGADANIIGDLLAKTYVSTGENSTAGGAYSATSYVTVGAGSEINEPSLGGGITPLPLRLTTLKGSYRGI